MTSFREAGDMEVRPAGAQDVDACVGILQSLPEYFTPLTHDALRRLMREPLTVAIVGERNGVVVAFAAAELRFAHAAEIVFAAVMADQRRQGLGNDVVEALLHELRMRQVWIVEVKTLDASSGYEPYVATRAFWEALGFVQVDCIDPLPGWDPGNPSAIFIKALRTT